MSTKTVAWGVSKKTVLALAAELVRGAECMGGDDTELVLEVRMPGTVLDEDGSVNAEPVLAISDAEYPEEGVYSIDPHNPTAGREAEQAQQAEPVARDVIAKLVALTRAVNIALDDSEERDGIDGREHAIDSVNFDAVCDALEALEDLPDDKPGWAMNAADKAEWALRHLPDAQQQAVAVPDGYALVPVLPTTEMLVGSGLSPALALQTYRAMLAAAQKGGAA